jgi:hypothetical protein
VSGRTFVVTVTESPKRVVVEDVWNRRRAVAADLDAVGGEIARLLETPPHTEGGNANRTEADR